MINQLEIPMYLEEALPELAIDMDENKKNNPYDLMNTLMAFTCKNINGHNFKIVKRCFQLADKLYNKGNMAVKNAVQNVFVYSFTTMFERYPAEKKQLLAILPITLYSLYIAQIHHIGC